MSHAPPKRRGGPPARDAAPNAPKNGIGHSTSHPQPQAEKPLLHSDRLRPRAEDAARQLIRSWCDYGPKQSNECNPDTLPGIFSEIGHGVLDATLNEGARDFAGVRAYFTGAPAGLLAEFVECNQGNSPQPEDCGPLLEAIREWHHAFRRDMLADRLRAALERGDDPAPILAEWQTLEAEGSADTGIAATLEARAFNFDSHPEKPIPVFMLAGMPLCTAGNITNVQALPKAGKSAVVESQIAAVMNGNRQGPDTLGFQAENPLGHALIHFDTEQSRYDADALIRRSCRRARVERPPEWFHSYAVADLDIWPRRQGLRHAMAEAQEKHGGIFAVLIDGIGDLCADPNDSEEAFDLVHELHALAIRYHCAIETVLHENPGSEHGKTRGHLGSQLERKAETNLRLAKDAAGVTTVWAERARHCYLPKDKGPCFAWSDEAAMHVSCGTSGELRQAANREKMQADAEKAFGEGESFRHCDLLEVVSDAFDIKERAAKDRIRKWAEEGIIRKDAAGNYHLSKP